MRVILALLLFLAHAAGIEPALSQQVGTAAAVNPSAQARGNGGSRAVVIGQSIAHRERIQTTSAGSVELLFLDKTAMTVGPNSDLSIDEYVYDPSTNTGKLAASLTRGVMRFVGGQISHAGNARISTPTAVVGIRGGIGIFNPNSVYIGYGEGVLTSGSSRITLGAGDYVQTFGGDRPPSTPGSPPPGYLQSVITLLQSRPGQTGGARVTERQVNRARRASSGTDEGNIATDLRHYLPYWPPVFPLPTFASVGQSIQTEANTGRVREMLSPGQDGSPFNPEFPTPPGVPVDQPVTSLFGFTAGLVQPIGANGQVGQAFAISGAMALVLDPERNRSQANLTVASSSQQSPNSLQTGNIQYGSLDPALPPGNITINQFDQLVGTASALQPAVSSNGTPLSTINDGPLLQHDGLFVEIAPGSQLSSALASQVGTNFCQCEHTRWGIWDSQSLRPGPNNSQINERGFSFWVAGRLPQVGEVPAFGSATYTGHAIANIRNGSQSYLSAGAFQNVVNFGSRSGTVSVTGLDSTNYAGRMVMNSSDPRFFSGSLSSLSGQSRNMAINGSFFTGSAGPVGEMGGALQITGPSYLGAGIFAARR